MSHPNLPTRDTVWHLECQHCKYRRRYMPYMKCLTSAPLHAERRQGHVVIVSYSTMAGDYFYGSFHNDTEAQLALLNPSTTTDEEPPF